MEQKQQNTYNILDLESGLAVDRWGVHAPNTTATEQTVHDKDMKGSPRKPPKPPKAVRKASLKRYMKAFAGTPLETRALLEVMPSSPSIRKTNQQQKLNRKRPLGSSILALLITIAFFCLLAFHESNHVVDPYSASGPAVSIMSPSPSPSPASSRSMIFDAYSILESKTTLEMADQIDKPSVKTKSWNGILQVGGDDQSISASRMR